MILVKDGMERTMEAADRTETKMHNMTDVLKPKVIGIVIFLE